MEAWAVKEGDACRLLGGISLDTYRDIQKHSDVARLNENTLTHISLVIGIYKALHTYFGSVADHWITIPNDSPLFGGTSPIEYMMDHGVSGMYEVRTTLDGWCQGQGH
jgi:hypothetical protein